MLESLHDVIMGTALLRWRRGLRATVQSGEVIRNNGHGFLPLEMPSEATQSSGTATTSPFEMRATCKKQSGEVIRNYNGVLPLEMPSEATQYTTTTSPFEMQATWKKQSNKVMHKNGDGVLPLEMPSEVTSSSGTTTTSLFEISATMRKKAKRQSYP